MLSVSNMVKCRKKTTEMKQVFLILLLLSYVENILRVSVAEYNRHNTRNNQVFLRL